jgi:regulator of protease activity HflC (stomatin/prohibitin superfamily)
MIAPTLLGLVCGFGLAALGTLLVGVYTIGPTQRGVLPGFGRAQRTNGSTSDVLQLGALLTQEERQRCDYPSVRVIQPVGPYFKWPWQRLNKVDMTIQAVDIAWDPDIQQDAI